MQTNIKDQGNAKSGLVATGTNSPIILLYTIVFHQYVMNRSLYTILLSLSQNIAKSDQFLLELIFFLLDNQTLQNM